MVQQTKKFMRHEEETAEDILKEVEKEGKEEAEEKEPEKDDVQEQKKKKEEDEQKQVENLTKELLRKGTFMKCPRVSMASPSM